MQELAVLTSVIDRTGICTLPLYGGIIRIRLSSFVAPEFSLPKAGSLRVKIEIEGQGSHPNYRVSRIR